MQRVYLVEKEMLGHKANHANEGQAQVQAQTVATAEFTPVQKPKRRGRPRNTEKSQRTKRKSRAKSLNYGVEEAKITEESL